MSETLPQAGLDLDFYENVILLNSLLDQDYLSSIIEHANPEYFNDASVRSVLKHVLHFFSENGAPPSLTEIKSRLTTDTDKSAFEAVVKRFKTFDSKFNKTELLSNTEKFLKERCLYKTIVDTAEKFSKGAADPSVILTEFEKAYNINLKEDLGHFYFQEVDDHIKDLTTLFNPIPTGWKFLDQRLEGGLFPKTLTCFIGQVNIGKSIFLGNIATNLVRDNRNVLLISLEMSEFMYSKRVSTQITQIPHNQLSVYTDDLKSQIEGWRDKLDSKLVIKEFPPKTITVRQIDGYLGKLLHKGFKPDVLVIDYINLLKPSTKNLNLYEGVKEVAEQLRALSFKHNIPIVTASQVNRGAINNGRPAMEGVSESIGLAATCDVMCSLWQEEEEKVLGTINLGMIKNRFGLNHGHCTFKVSYETLTLSEIDNDYFADNPQTEVLNSATSSLSNILNEK